VSTTQIYRVDGMTCGHCVHAVITELNVLDGVTDVYVSLVPGATSTVEVSSDVSLDVAEVEAAIEAAGYALAGNG
jgi:copper chaperone